MLAAGSQDSTVWIWNGELRLVTRFAAGKRSAPALSWKPEPARPTIPQSVPRQLDPVAVLAFSRDGRRLAVATRSGTVQWADANDWEHRVTLCTDAADVACLAWDPGDSALVAKRAARYFAGKSASIWTRNKPWNRPETAMRRCRRLVFP